MFLYAEKGSQAEYEAFAALSALLPAEVSEAVPLQIRQLAPRPPMQNDVIDLVQIDSPAVPSATSSAATTAQALLANQLCESLSTRLLHGFVTIFPMCHSTCLSSALHQRLRAFTSGPLTLKSCIRNSKMSFCVQLLRWPPCGKLSKLCGRRQRRYRWQATRHRSQCRG